MNNLNDDEPISEINIIPFVDIMLVLMILFLVMAPLLVPYVIEVNLAETEGQMFEESLKKPITLLITAEQTLRWQAEIIDLEILEKKFASFGQQKVQPPIHVQVDKSVNFELVAKVLGLAQNYDIKSLGFVTKSIDLNP